MSTPKFDLLEAIGGEEILEKSISKWYELLAEDHIVGKFFSNAHSDIDKLQRMQKKFLLHVIEGAPRITKFTKRSMRQAHSNLNLTDRHFDRVKDLLGGALLSLHINPDYIEKILVLAETTRNDILGREEPLKPSEIFEKIGGEKAVEDAYNIIDVVWTSFMIW
jgi:hemoglobin